MAGPNWVNRAIVTGDNLDILRKMNSDCVDLIYLDPPFNSKRNYEAPIGSEAAGAAFKDTWTLSDLDDAWLGLIADVEPAMYRVVETAGLAHGKGMKSYLCMMAVRLTEMRRVLKSTGSIYLHCDPTASHYLKALMDVVFGAGNFKNAITWKRYFSHNDARKFGRITDTLLYYAPPGATWETVRIPLNSDEIEKRYSYRDERGRYATSPLHARTLQGGGYEYEWRGISDVWKFPKERLEELDADSHIHWPERGNVPRRKVYLSEHQGKPVCNLWDDIPPVFGKERIGYPTQKPMALMERIYSASTNEGDVVLDPFCGCATACVTAEMMNRQWIGIDISKKAAELVVKRVKDYQGLFQDITHYDGVKAFPDRNDVLGLRQSYKEMKHVLFGQQEGFCKICGGDFPFRMFEIDHVIPRSKGGPDHIENRQLLCPPCNKLKSDGTMEAAIAKYQETYANSPFMKEAHA